MPLPFVTAGSKDDELRFSDRKVSDVAAKPSDLNDLLGKVRALCPP